MSLFTGVLKKLKRKKAPAEEDLDLTVEEAVKRIWDEHRLEQDGLVIGTMHRLPKVIELKRGDKAEYNWLMAQDIDPYSHFYKRIAIFPEPQHAQTFLDSKTRPGGYQMFFSGGAAAMSFSHDIGDWNLDGIQNMYKLPFDKNLSRGYSDAREILLNYFFGFAASNSVPELSYTIYPFEVDNPDFKFKLFETAGNTYGYFFKDRYEVKDRFEKPDYFKYVMQRK
ncbi:MAG: hypothetical protein NDI94_04705 [Candidatus Woesearchaeota archaeon]|nr:hypothetical protein [Candidatus Woesearchaeota archaeon]